MKINNKKAWNVRIEDANGDFIIHDSYENEFISCLKKIWLETGDDKVKDIRDNDISYMFIYNNITWEIADNGGEVNVIVVNGESISIPYIYNGHVIKPIDLAYRVSFVIKSGTTNIMNFPLNSINWEHSTSKASEITIYKTYNIKI